MRVEQFGQPSVSRSRVPLGVAALMLLLAVPVAAAAQAASSGVMADDRAGRACLDTLSDANLTRVTVSQRAILTETNPAVLAQTALISQRIAAAARCVRRRRRFAARRQRARRLAASDRAPPVGHRAASGRTIFVASRPR